MASRFGFNAGAAKVGFGSPIKGAIGHAEGLPYLNQRSSMKKLPREKRVRLKTPKELFTEGA